MRATGRPLTVTGPDMRAAVSKLRSFHARGMSYDQMGKQVGLSPRTVCEAAKGRAFMYRATWLKLSGLRFEEPLPHVWVAPLGVRRRLGALWLAGFPLPWLSEQLGMSRRYLQALLKGTKGVRGVEYRTHRAVSELYDKLEDRTPGELGVDPRASAFCRTHARKHGFAPRSCWDPDTVDDPNAVPDYTGRCGTAFGMVVHRREGIPVCGPCRRAYTGEMYPGFDGGMFRKLRERRGFSQQGLADRIGVDGGTVFFWESGRSVPQRKFRLDAALDVLDGTYEDVCKEKEEE